MREDLQEFSCARPGGSLTVRERKVVVVVGWARSVHGQSYRSVAAVAIITDGSRTEWRDDEKMEGEREGTVLSCSATYCGRALRASRDTRNTARLP
jgi:hypothetical protein